jgi:hypothetical protein
MNWRKENYIRGLSSDIEIKGFFYCCVCIRCSGHVFREPLSSDVMGDTQTNRQQGDIISLNSFFFEVRKAV